MKEKLWKVVAGAAAVAAFALGGAAIAAAGSGSKSGTRPARPARTPETPLTGDTLAKASAAAIAKVGGTVEAATTENAGRVTGAAYEVHVTKADGSHVTVVLDKGFAVLSVETGVPHGGPGGGPGGPSGGPGGHGETPIAGDAAANAKAAAVAKVGGTADFASTENDSTLAGAAYEVHVTKADGSHVEVVLDQDFNVLAVDARR